MDDIEDYSINNNNPLDSDLDFSFSSLATTATATTVSARSSLARTSLTLSFNESRLSSSAAPPYPSTAVPISTLRPHCRHNNPNWEAVRAASTLSSTGSIRLRDLHLLRQVGAGNLGRVFLCRLRDHDHADFALKVVDRDSLSSKKLSHVNTEAAVLADLDHPFLPTLYAHLEASHYICLLMDYCSNGDLHSLLHKQPSKKLPIHAVRFFAAEVLLALEYLHAQGIVYRDLKPENILIRSDGHIMLSDFDLCFRSDVSPKLHRRDRVTEFVAEPTEAFSKSCVGTHEYLAPEVLAGGGYGNGVDWWAYGVLIYELVYGTTPFKGGSKESTLRNIASTKGARFPDEESGSSEVRDLIEKLLVKDPRRRLGSGNGATDIKRHPFFSGIKWPLIRTYRPPEVRGLVVRSKVQVGGAGSGAATPRRRRWLWKRVRKMMMMRMKKGVNSKYRGVNCNSNFYAE